MEPKINKIKTLEEFEIKWVKIEKITYNITRDKYYCSCYSSKCSCTEDQIEYDSKIRQWYIIKWELKPYKVKTRLSQVNWLVNNQLSHLKSISQRDMIRYLSEKNINSVEELEKLFKN